MAALAIKKQSGGKLSLRGSKLPTKRRINLADVEEKPVKVKFAVPAIVLILVVAVLFSKFAVVDRLIAVSVAQNEVAQLQARLDEDYRIYDSYGELTELYAHYTFSGLTAEELQRADRVGVVSLVERIVMPRAQLENWTLTGNQLVLSMTGSTLQEINRIVQDLEADELVNFCTVSTAATNNTDIVSTSEDIGEDLIVTARVVAYLNPTEYGG